MTERIKEPKLEAKDLVTNRDYIYWNRSVYEKKASLKRCKFKKVINSKYALVMRYDLSVGAAQTVEITRLKEIPNCEELGGHVFPLLTDRVNDQYCVKCGIGRIGSIAGCVESNEDLELKKEGKENVQ